VIQFKSLSHSIIRHVVDKFIFELESLLVEKNVTLMLDEDARQWLANNGCDSKMGARPMARLIQEKVKTPLANELLFGKLTQGGHVLVSVQNSDLSLDVQSKDLVVIESEVVEKE